MELRTRLVIGALIGAVLAAYALWPADERRPARPPTGEPSSTSEPSAREAAPLPATPAAPADDGPARDGGGAVLVRARWGSRRGELGHERPQEGNAEGPASFVVTGDELVVVDQTNARLVRYDARGQQIASSEIPATVQDVAAAPNGNLLLLDRLGGKTVTVTDARGRRVGELGLPDDPGTLTGVFVDGKDVYVEREHGALVRVGTTDGRTEDQPRELQGRPTKDGALLLTAIVGGGRVVLNAFDRKRGALRFARAVEYVRPVRGVVLLDSDLAGTIYVGASAGEPEQAHVACLDATDGRVLGRVALPTSHVPEESFRDLVVSADGTIVYALRSDDGVEYRTARCP